jgi:23S rRNA (guanosine2251-2'-O)-methyltransferase
MIVKSSRPKKPSREPNENQSFHVKHRSSDSMQLVFGMRPVLEAIQSDTQIEKILIQTGLDGSLFQELRAAIKEKSLPFQYVPVEKLNRLTSGNHQGVVATVSPIRYHSFADTLQDLVDKGIQPLFLLLDHITDVRNMGAIVRTAECAGIHAVIIPDHGSAQINEDAIKTSSGALLRMTMCREPNFKTVINLARQYDVQICAATEKGATSYLNVDFSKPTLLIMGSEDTGISSDLLKLADVKACLPINGDIQSLNVSVAAGIFMYEALRQRNS